MLIFNFFRKKVLISSLYLMLSSCGESKFLNNFDWEAQQATKESTRNNPIQTDIYLLESQKDIFGKYVQVTGVVTAVAKNSGFYIEGLGQNISGIWIDNYLPVWPEIGDLVEIIGLVNSEENSLYIILRKIRFVNKGPEDRINIEAAKIENTLSSYRGALVTFDAKVIQKNENIFLSLTGYDENVLLGQRFFQKFPYLLGGNYKFTAILDSTKDSFIIYPRSEKEVILLDDVPNLPKESIVESIVLRNFKQNPNALEDKNIQFYSYVTAVGEGGFYVQDSSLCYDASWVHNGSAQELSRGDRVLVTAKIKNGGIHSFASQKVLTNKRFYSALNQFVCNTDRNTYCPYFDGTLSQIEGVILEDKNNGSFVIQDSKGYNIILNEKITSYSFCPGAKYKIFGFFGCGQNIEFSPRSKSDINKLDQDINC